MKKFFYTIITLLILLFVSCKNDSDDTITVELPKNYGTSTGGYTYTTDDYPVVKCDDGEYLLINYFCAQDTPSTASTLKDQMLSEESRIKSALSQVAQSSDVYSKVTCVTLYADNSNIYVRQNKSLEESDIDYKLSWLRYDSGSLKGKPRSLGSGEMLEDFLYWTHSHFDCKNVILNISDHGTGPYLENMSYQSCRLICVTGDYPTYSCLSSTAIEQALKKSRYYGDRRPKLLIENACLQSSVEILYPLRCAADYYLSSPNISYDLYAFDIIKTLKKGLTIEEVGRALVDQYYNTYKNNSIYRAYGFKEVSGSYDLTMTLCKISDSDVFYDLKNYVSRLAESLLYTDSSRTIARNYLSRSYSGGFCYTATMSYLRDIASFAQSVKNDVKSTSSMKSCAQGVLDALGDIIVYARAFHGSTVSWCTDKNDESVRSSKTVTPLNLISGGDNLFGVTINASFYTKRNEEYALYNEFGRNNSWGSLLYALYPQGEN